MNIADEDLEAMSEEMMNMMGPLDEDEEDFTPGGAATFPFLKQVFGDNLGTAEGPAAKSDAQGKETKDKKSAKKSRKRKFLDLY